MLYVSNIKHILQQCLIQHCIFETVISIFRIYGTL